MNDLNFGSGLERYLEAIDYLIEKRLNWREYQDEREKNDCDMSTINIQRSSYEILYNLHGITDNKKRDSIDGE